MKLGGELQASASLLPVPIRLEAADLRDWCNYLFSYYIFIFILFSVQSDGRSI